MLKKLYIHKATSEFTLIYPFPEGVYYVAEHRDYLTDSPEDESLTVTRIISEVQLKDYEFVDWFLEMPLPDLKPIVMTKEAYEKSNDTIVSKCVRLGTKVFGRR
jgi:hypothetical protein